MFAEIYRVLKPGGVFYMSTPFRSIMSNILDPAWWLIGHRHYSIVELQLFARQTDFNIIVIKIKGGVFSLLADLNMYIAKWVFRRQLFFRQFFAKKEMMEYDDQRNDKYNISTIFAKFVK